MPCLPEGKACLQPWVQVWGPRSCGLGERSCPFYLSSPQSEGLVGSLFKSDLLPRHLWPFKNLLKTHNSVGTQVLLFTQTHPSTTYAMWKISSLLGCSISDSVRYATHIAFFLISRFIVKTVVLRLVKFISLSPRALTQKKIEDFGVGFIKEVLTTPDFGDFWIIPSDFLTPCSHLLCYMQTKDECVFLGGVNSGAMFRGWSFSLYGTSVHSSPVYTLNGWSSILIPTESWNLSWSSDSLHSAVTHQGSPFLSRPSTLWTSSHPTSFLSLVFFYASKFWSLYKSHPPFWGPSFIEILAPSTTGPSVT